MPKREISVVVPCFNEGKTIYENIKKINHYLSGRFDSFEIIAVNDGSRDNTSTELKRIQNDIPLVKIIDNSLNEGKGKAVKDGVMAAKYEIIMFLDADLGIPIEQLDNFIVEIEKGCDMVIASRFVPGMKVLSPILWYRKFMERVFRILRMIIINNYAIQDTQCGFKVFTRKLALDVFPRMTVKRFAFDAELVFIAGTNKYKIKELPVILKNPIRSSIRIYHDSLNMLYDLLRIRWNFFNGVYKKKV